MECTYNPLTNAIEELGIGRFTYKLVAVLSLVQFSGGIQLSMGSNLSPYLQCIWGLTAVETSIMAASTYIGLGFGSIICGWFADQRGRRPALIITLFVCVYFNLLSTVTDFYWFIIVRFFVGVGTSSITLPLCIISEFVPIRFRSIAGLACNLNFSVAIIFVNVIEYYTITTVSAEGSTNVLVLCTLPTLLCLLLSVTLPESIRFLSNCKNGNDRNDIRETLQLISKQNKKTFQTSVSSIVQYQKEETKVAFSFNLFKPCDHMYATFERSILVGVALFNYYSLLYWDVEILEYGEKSREWNTRDKCAILQKSDYLQNMLVSVFDLLGNLFALAVVEKVGRKKLIVIAFLFQGVLYLMLSIHMSFGLLTAIICVGRFVCHGTISVVLFYVAELFPTPVRVKGVGICYTIGYISILFVPLLIQNVAIKHKLAVTIGYAIWSVLASVVCMMQRETKGSSVDVKGKF